MVTLPLGTYFFTVNFVFSGTSSLRGNLLPPSQLNSIQSIPTVQRTN